LQSAGDIGVREILSLSPSLCLTKHLHPPSLTLFSLSLHTHTNIRVARSKKLKRPYLAKSSFKKGQILKNEKRPYKGQISLKKFVKI